MSILRGEISDPFIIVKDFGGPNGAEPRVFCTVSVETEILAQEAKSVLDVLLSAAHGAGHRTTVTYPEPF